MVVYFPDFNAVLKNSRISKGDFGGSPSDRHPTDPDLDLCQSNYSCGFFFLFHETVIDLEFVL